MNFSKYLITAISNPLSVPWKIFNILRRRIPIDYYFFNGWSLPPEMVTILITKKCNFSCAGCSSSSPEYTKKNKQKELGTKEIKKIIDEISWFKPNIYFCGGEPTLRSDLFELISYAKSKGLVTAFTTNGSLLNNTTISKIINSGLDFVSFSLDGGAKHHNTYRGFPNAYERLISAIAELVKQKQKYKKNNPNIRITCIINPADKKDSIFVLKKGEELGVNEVAYGNLMFYPVEYSKKQLQIIKKFGIGGPHMIGLPIKNRKFPFKISADLNNLYDEIKKIAKIPVSFVPSSIDYKKFFSFSELLDKSKCLSPWFVATVMPNGDLTSCQEYIIGNIKKEKFLKLWNNNKMRKLRIYRKKKPFPACFRCLEGQDLQIK